MAETTTYITVQQKYRSLLKSCKNLISTEDIRLVRKAFRHGNEQRGKFTSGYRERYSSFAGYRINYHVRDRVGEDFYYLFDVASGNRVRNVEIGTDKNGIWRESSSDISRFTGYKPYLRYSPGGGFRKFPKLLLSFAEDVRVQLIFLAEKLYDLRHAETLLPEQQRELARETSYIYIPFAHRLGLYNIKSEMEDLALRYGEPEVYKEISLKLEGTREAREKYINEFIAPIVEEFNNRGIKFKVKWRTKTIASILNKMRKKQVEFEEIYDIFAVRFILDSRGPEEKADCWRAYSIVADKYTPNPQRLRDWISVPKSNGYESLQTTVLGPNNRWVEVQIRTERMDEIAEKGFAAHWKYKGERRIRL